MNGSSIIASPSLGTRSASSHVMLVSCTGKKAITDLVLTRLLFLLAYVCLFIVGTLGNLLVIWVVLSCKSMQTVTNVFIANLALSDLLVCLTSIWLTPTYTYIGHWIWGGLCYALPLFQGASIFISSLSLTAIALDRYWVICLAPPHQHAQAHASKQVCLAVIWLIWSVSILLALPYAVHMRIAQVQWPCHFSLCIEDWADHEHVRSVYGITTAVLQFVLPFAIIGRSYRRIWQYLGCRGSMKSEKQLARKRRLLRMLVRMVLVFGLCWLPFNLLNLLRDLRIDGWLKPYFSFLFLLAHLLSMVVPAANPLLYAWMNSAFRDAFLRVLPFCSRQRTTAIWRRNEQRKGILGENAVAEEGEEEMQSSRTLTVARRSSRLDKLSSTFSLRLSPLLLDKWENKKDGEGRNGATTRTGREGNNSN